MLDAVSTAVLLIPSVVWSLALQLKAKEKAWAGVILDMLSSSALKTLPANEEGSTLEDAAVSLLPELEGLKL